jgi:predicted Rdx family selenoprotein
MRQLKSVQPRNNGTFVITFDSNQMVINFSFKGNFPTSKAWKLLIEDKVISLLPQNSRGNHKVFHQVRP